jgi:hypothetical protein
MQPTDDHCAREAPAEEPLLIIGPIRISLRQCVLAVIAGLVVLVMVDLLT